MRFNVFAEGEKKVRVAFKFCHKILIFFFNEELNYFLKLNSNWKKGYTKT